MPTNAAYAVTKAGVEAVISVSAKERRGRNVAVNAIAQRPTPVGSTARPCAPTAG